MSADRWILAIDLGNGGPKVAVIGMDDAIAAVSFREVAVHIGLDGAATQDADEWWTQLVSAAREVVDVSGVARDGLHAVAITGQWGTTVPVDTSGRPVGPALLWADTRAGRYLRDVIGGPLSYQGFAPHKVLPWVRRTGGAPTPSGADPTGHSLLLQHEYADVYERAALPARTRRLPGNEIHRSPRGDAGVDDPQLDHRQPARPRAGVRPRDGAAGPTRSRPAATAGAHRDGPGDRCSPRWPPTSTCRPESRS